MVSDRNRLSGEENPDLVRSNTIDHLSPHVLKHIIDEKAGGYKPDEEKWCPDNQ